MKLIYTSTNDPVKIGDTGWDEGSNYTVTAILKPQTPASTGRVELTFNWGVMCYYPAVIGAEWVEREDQLEPEPEPEPVSSPLCFNCKHFVDWAIKNPNAAEQQRHAFSYCNRNLASSLVIPNCLNPEDSKQFCSIERKYTTPDSCGPDGKYFSPCDN